MRSAPDRLPLPILLLALLLPATGSVRSLAQTAPPAAAPAGLDGARIEKLTGAKGSLDPRCTGRDLAAEAFDAKVMSAFVRATKPPPEPYPEPSAPLFLSCRAVR